MPKKRKTVEELESRFRRANEMLKENDTTGIYYAFFSVNEQEKGSWEVNAYSLNEAWQKILADKKRGRIPHISKTKNYKIRAYLSHTVKHIVRFPED